MTPEINILVWSVVFVFAHIMVQVCASILDRGLVWAVGPQDEQRPATSRFTRQIEKSQRNFLETYPVFIALALALTLTQTGTETSATGAAVWFWGRVAYVPICLAGLPYIRTAAWAGSMTGLVMMLWPLLQV